MRIRCFSTSAKPAAIALAAIAAGCGRYSDFALPAPSGGASPVRWEWRADADPLRTPALGEVDVLNPSAANGRLFYSVFDGKTWHTALDGKRVMSPNGTGWEGGYIAANGSILFRKQRDGQERYEHWYHAGGPEIPSIGYATSPDGKAWAKHPEPVLTPGPRGAWDERGVADPYVIEAGGKLYLFYLGQDRARRQRLGVAESADGIVWSKLRTTPILELGDVGAFDEVGLGEPAVWTSHGAWWMLYTGRARDEVRRLGLARSVDGVRWQKVRGFVAEGTEAWNAKTVCDPHVEPQPDGAVKVWFGGGDVAHPAEGVHGRIGTATLTPVLTEVTR